ncbi:MAG: relaxase/mobilization nuclease domain-containing protein, partial [Eubacterium sp.]
MPFGNVNVKYQPCKSVGQLKSAVNYMLGIQPEQIRNGVVKTQDHLYSALGCNRDNFANSILVTRKLNGRSYSRIKENNIIAHKLSISFHQADNEKLSYELAYKIAEEFANEFMYSKGYEVLFAVHTDTEHIHVHFLVSNCNIDTGKSYRRNKKMLYDMSEYFGNQCIQHGLTHSVRNEFYNHEIDASRDNLTFAEYQMRKKGKESFKDELREVIQVEIADKANKTFDDVMAALWRHYNVETRVKGNTVSYRHPEYKDKNGKLVSVRGSKLGDLYTRKGIEYELTKKLTKQYEQSAEAQYSGEITDTTGKHRHPYGNIGKPVAETTDLTRGQLERGRGQATANGISDDSGRNVQSSNNFYERYRKRHQKSKRRTN